MDVKNVSQIFIAKNCPRTANVQIHDSANSTTYIGKGEVVIVDPQGNVLSATTALKSVDYIQIVQRSTDGDVVYKSSPIYGKFLRDFSCRVYTAATEKVVYLGYNGTAGTFNANLAADTHYFVKLVPRNNVVLQEFKPKSFSYKSGITTPTDADIVTGIVKRMSYDLLGETNMNVIAEALCNNAGTAITGTGTLTVVNGSASVKAGTDADAVVVAGDYLRINSTATTGSMYKIKSINTVTNVITLEYPYQGTSGIIAEASNEYVSAANGATAEWGIKISGQPFKYERFNYRYSKEDFEVLTGENILSQAVVSSVANPGVGTFEAVSDMEADYKGYFGNMPITHPNYVVNFPQDANSAETYDIISIGFSYKDTETTNSTYFQGNIIIAAAIGAGHADGGTTTIKEVLNKYIVTEWGVDIAIAVP